MKNIKTRIYLITLFAITITNEINAQNWVWSNQIGSIETDGGVNIITDSYGSVYYTGFFDGSYLYYANDTSFLCQGDNDFFLVKYDVNGNFLWLKQLGGYNTGGCNEGIGGIAIDVSNNIYITGGFCGSVNFGAFNLTGWGQEIFLAKYDTGGTCLWAKKAGGIGNDAAVGVALDNLGYIYTCGTNSDSATFDNLTIPRGGFIAKYDTSGNIIWAKNKFGAVYLSAFGTAVPPSGIKIYNSNILISGQANNDTIVVDTITVITQPNTYSNFLSCFDLNGNVQWLRLPGGPNSQGSGYDLAVDNTGNIYITGSFKDIGYFENDTLHNGTQKDAFIAKYDINGNLQWVEQLNASGGAYGYNISTDGDGNTYFTGRFTGNASFGSYNINASSTYYDMFVARYNNAGSCLGVRNFGAAKGLGVTQNSNGNPYVCGTFSLTTSIGSNTFTSYGLEDIFVAKCDVFTGIGGEERIANNQLIIYANPNQGKCNITVPDDFLNEKNLVLSIYDNTGKLIQQKTLQMNDGKIKLSLDAEAKSIYNVTLSSKSKSYSGRIVFE